MLGGSLTDTAVVCQAHATKLFWHVILGDMATPTDDVGARVKAARTYARLEPEQLAELLTAAGFKFSRRTLDRLEAGDRHLDVREARVIAESTGAPVVFLTRGWWTPADMPERLADLLERVTRLEEELLQAQAERDVLIEAISEIGELLQERLGSVVAAASLLARPQRSAQDRRSSGKRPAR